MEIIFNRKLSRLFLSTSSGWGTHYFYCSWVAQQRGGKWRGMSSLPQVLTSKMSLFWLWEPESEEMTASFSGAPSMFLPPLRQQRSEGGVLGPRAQHYRLWSVRPCYLISASFCFLPPWRYCKDWTTRVGAGTVPGPCEAHDQEGQQLLGLRHMVAGHGTWGNFRIADNWAMACPGHGVTGAHGDSPGLEPRFSLWCNYGQVSWPFRVRFFFGRVRVSRIRTGSGSCAY